LSSIASQSDQLLALPKLRADAREFQTREDLLALLVRSTNFEQVKAEIRRNFRNTEGPFADFKPLAPEFYGDLPSYYISSMIVHAQDGKRQALLLKTASHLQTFCFLSLKTAALQLEALKKLEPDLCTATPVTQQYEALLQGALNQAVRTRITALFKERAGPFKLAAR
jgi:hypothetical protein